MKSMVFIGFSLKTIVFQIAAYAFSAAEWTNCSLTPLSSMAHRSTACFLFTFTVIERASSDGGPSTRSHDIRCPSHGARC